MGTGARWESTQIDLYRGEGKFRVVRLSHVRSASIRQVAGSDVTPEAWEGERDGGFSEALAVARAVSGPGELVRVRYFERDRRRERRMVNTYRVELPNPKLQQERRR